jgi:hypothetical protein
MANLLFHNNSVSLNDVWYESHLSVLKAVCMECGQPEKILELQTKLLGDKMKIKMKKDPNKPKRAKTGFMFYCDEHRPKLINDFKKKNQKVDIKIVAKKLGASWGALNDTKKEKYSLLAAKDKERYLEAMVEYNEKNEF